MLAGLHPGCILPAVVTHLESFGAFVDIGCGVPSLIGIENISVSRIPHPDQRFRVGQAIFAVVQELDPKLGRVYLTHRELLGTWAENAARFQAGMTVPGIVRGLKEYGALWSSPRICPAWRSGKAACGRGTVCPSTSRLSCLSG